MITPTIAMEHPVAVAGTIIIFLGIVALLTFTRIKGWWTQ